jgi:hypothetical protein
MMESTPRRTTPAAPATEADRRAQDKAFKEATDKEIAERLSSPPETPTPTQEEADAAKSGTLGEQRDVKPAAAASGYTTR